ncbi:MBG domain-containing protein [Enterococcus sp. AZ103]|uniref:MBG domain-containing protein n=1 Tax=Enterococcus sp. AZ103 TaxID=2774628 RepID=UPI003F26BCDE
MKERQKFKLIKWNKQLISVATGVLFVSQLAVGSVNVMAETPDYVPASSLKNQNDTNQLTLGMSNAIITGENQKTVGNNPSVSQTKASKGTTRNGPSVQDATKVPAVDELKTAIGAVAAGGSAEFTWDGELEIDGSAIAIEGKNITLTSTDGATIKRMTGYTGNVFIVTEDGAGNKGSLTINGVNVDGNANNSQGESLISVTQSTFTLEDGTIENGNGREGPGAILARGTSSEISIKGGIISNNYSNSRGGAISSISRTNYSDDTGIINIEGGTIKENQSNEGAGGIYVSNGGTVNIKDEAAIIGNSGGAMGGALFLLYATLNMEGGTISENERAGNGGGVYAMQSKVNISGGTISNNKCSYIGGGIFITGEKSEFDMTGGRIVNNTSNNGGSAICNDNIGTFTLTISGGLIYGEADATNGLVYNYRTGGDWEDITDDAVIIANAKTSSPYTWESDKDLTYKYGEDIQSEGTNKWTIQEDADGNNAVGVAYKYTDSQNALHEGFIPETDAQFALNSDMFQKVTPSNLTYTGEVQNPAISVEAEATYGNAALADVISQEVSKTPTFLNQSTSASERDVLKNAGTYDVLASVTPAVAPAVNLLNGSAKIGEITINKASRTQADFDYDQKTTLYLKEDGTGLTLGATDIVKNKAEITSFSVRYIKTDDSNNRELTEMTETGKYRIKLINIEDDSPNHATPDGIVIADAEITVENQVKPDSSYYQADVPSNHTYSGSFPTIEIDEIGGNASENKGEINTVFKQKGETAETTTPNVGNYEVYARNGGTDKYASVDVKLGDLTITKKRLSITAVDVEVQQGADLPEATVKYAGFVTGENENSIFFQLPTANYLGDTTEVGTSEIEVTAGKTNTRGENYNLAYKSGTLTVTEKKPDASLYEVEISAEHVYNGQFPEIKVTTDHENLGTLSTVIKQGEAEGQTPNVGTYQVYVRNAGSDDYTGADTLVGEFTITAKPLTITAADVEVAQGAILPAVTINYSEFAEGEEAATIFSSLPTGRFTGDSGTVGTSAIEVTPGTENQQAKNYAIRYVAGTLTVKGNSDEEQDRLPVYRVYNPNNGEHLYTLSAEEARWLIDDIGLNDEGISWHAGKTTGKAVYRLYNPNSGEHFYTLDQSEYNGVGSAGWTQEGIAFYTAEDTKIPIYRVFNPNSQDAGSHHYTLSTAENTWLLREGWKSEGIGFYGK